jgi:hypothetical protein
MSAVAITISALRASPAVSALVGPRIEPVLASQAATLPGLVVTLARETEGYALAGRGGFREAFVIVDARAASYAAADVLAEAVIDALADLRNVEIAGRTASFLRDDLSASDRGEAGDLFRRRQGVVVWWR